MTVIFKTSLFVKGNTDTKTLLVYCDVLAYFANIIAGYDQREKMQLNIP